MKRLFSMMDHVSDLWMVGATICFAGALALFFGGIAGALFAGLVQLVFGLSDATTKGLWEVSAIVWFPIPLGMFVSAVRSWRVKPMRQREAEDAIAGDQHA
jgi:hypothetical protein